MLPQVFGIQGADDDIESAISLTALSSTYPDVSDPDFGSIIASKHEFKMIDMNEIPEPGELYPHQKLMLRVLSRGTPYQNMMIFWSTGAGKTRFALELILNYLHYHQSYGNSINSHKPVIIMKKSIKGIWQSEMMKMPQFQSDAIRENKAYPDVKSRRKAETDAISRFVELKTQDALANELEKLSNEQIAQKYEGRPIFIDEFHTLRMKDALNFDEQGIAFNPLREVPPQQLKDKKKYKKYLNKKVYIQLLRLMQLTRGPKIGLSASFMPDRPVELVSVTSLFLPREKWLNSADFLTAFYEGKKSLLEYLEPKLRGMISYVPANQGTARFIEEGQTFQRILEDGRLVTSTIKVVSIPMEQEQDEVFEITKEGGVSGSEEKELSQSERFALGKRKAANFVYINPEDPQRSSASGFEFFEDVGEGDVSTIVANGFVQVDPPLRRTYREQQLALKERERLKAGVITRDQLRYQRRQRLGKHAFTFRFENQLFQDVPPRPSKLNFHGKQSKSEIETWNARLEVIRRFSCKYAWIIDYVHNNLLHANEGEMTYYYYPLIRDGGGILLGMCFDLMGYKRFTGESNNVNELDDYPRYAYYAGDPASTVARNKNILEVANSPANAYGRKIMIVIASDVGATGLSFLNARKFIHGGATYTLYRQPLGRTKRLDSHLEFPPEKRYVRVALLAALRADGSQTVEHDIWFQVQNKEEAINAVEEVLKEISADCSFTADRADSDLKDVCAGSEGRGIEQLPRDYSTYHMFWGDDEYDAIEFELRRIFSIKPYYRLAEIVRLLQGRYASPTIVWALARMLSRRDIVRDRYGLSKVLREENGTYYLSDLFDEGLSATQYIRELSLPAPIDSKDLYIDFSKKEAQAKAANVGEYADFKKMWGDLKSNTDAKLVLLEQALLNQVKSPIREFVLKELSPVWFISGKCIFHYYEAIRPKGAGGGYKNNMNALTSAAVIRIACEGDKSFRQASAGEGLKLVGIINKFWQEEEQRILAESGLGFIGIRSISSDDEFRIKQNRIRTRNDGKVDGRGDRGLKIQNHKPNDIRVLLAKMGINSEGMSSSEASNALIQALELRGYVLYK